MAHLIAMRPLMALLMKKATMRVMLLALSMELQKEKYLAHASAGLMVIQKALSSALLSAKSLESSLAGLMETQTALLTEKHLAHLSD